MFSFSCLWTQILTSLVQPHLSLFLLDTKLAQPYPGHYTSQHKHTRHNDRPMLNMGDIETVCCPARCTNGRKTQRRNHVTRDPVVLVNRLGIVYAAVDLWHIVLREAYERLDVYKNVKCESETCMRRLKVFVAWPGFVHFDDDEAGSQGRGAQDMEEEMRNCSCALLLRGVGWLQDKGSLDGEEEASGVEKLDGMVRRPSSKHGGLER
jgi:hypothetical protein